MSGLRKSRFESAAISINFVDNSDILEYRIRMHLYFARAFPDFRMTILPAHRYAKFAGVDPRPGSTMRRHGRSHVWPNGRKIMFIRSKYYLGVMKAADAARLTPIISG